MVVQPYLPKVFRAGKRPKKIYVFSGGKSAHWSPQDLPKFRRGFRLKKSDTRS
jgi:hypothetical protein